MYICMSYRASDQFKKYIGISGNDVRVNCNVTLMQATEFAVTVSGTLNNVM